MWTSKLLLMCRFSGKGERYRFIYCAYTLYTHTDWQSLQVNIKSLMMCYFVTASNLFIEFSILFPQLEMCSTRAIVIKWLFTRSLFKSSGQKLSKTRCNGDGTAATDNVHNEIKLMAILMCERFYFGIAVFKEFNIIAKLNSHMTYPRASERAWAWAATVTSIRHVDMCRKCCTNTFIFVKLNFMIEMAIFSTAFFNVCTVHIFGWLKFYHVSMSSAIRMVSLVCSSFGKRCCRLKTTRPFHRKWISLRQPESGMHYGLTHCFCFPWKFNKNIIKISLLGDPKCVVMSIQCCYTFAFCPKPTWQKIIMENNNPKNDCDCTVCLLIILIRFILIKWKHFMYRFAHFGSGVGSGNYRNRETSNAGRIGPTLWYSFCSLSLALQI